MTPACRDDTGSVVQPRFDLKATTDNAVA